MSLQISPSSTVGAGDSAANVPVVTVRSTLSARPYVNVPAAETERTASGAPAERVTVPPNARAPAAESVALPSSTKSPVNSAVATSSVPLARVIGSDVPATPSEPAASRSTAPSSSLTFATVVVVAAVPNESVPSLTFSGFALAPLSLTAITRCVVPPRSSVA